MNHTPETCPMNARMAAVEKKRQRTTRIAEVIFDSDMIATRLTLALAELIWALTLFWHGDTFSRPTYSLMSEIAIEELWGAVFLLTAWTQWSLLLIGDFECRFARLFAAWNALLWGFVVIAMYFSVTPPPAAISGEAALALAAGWILIRPWVLTLTAWRVKRRGRV